MFEFKKKGTKFVIKETLAKQDNYAAFPYRGQSTDPKNVIGSIEPAPVGYDVLFNLIQHLEGIMRRDL
jgi:hypothetical protein